MRTFNESIRRAPSTGGVRIIVLLALGLVSIALFGCVSDSDKCGDDMEWVVPPGFGEASGYCLPKEVATDTALPGTDTGVPDMDASVPDGGDAAVDTDVAPACEANEDCGAGYYCDRTFTPAECVPNPTGQGEPCQTDADCVGFVADYCEVTVSGTCLVKGCDPVISNCSEGYHCCDFADWGLPTLCIDAELSGGVCQ